MKLGTVVYANKIYNLDYMSIEEMKEDGTWDELSDGNKRVLEEATAFARSEEGKKYFEFLMSGIKNKENQQRYPWRT